MKAWTRWVMAVAMMAVAALGAAHQAVTVRAHPWLTRGVGRESLAGLRFWGEQGAWGGGLSAVTFTIRYEGCDRADLGDFHLWRMPFNCNYAFYEPRAVRLDGAYGTLTETATGDGALTLTFVGRTSGVAEGSPDWFYPHTPGRVESDYLWLTADLAADIPSTARVWVDVASDQVAIGGCVYAVTNGAAQAPHRVYPFTHRVLAYLRSDYVKGTTRPNGRYNSSDILDDAPDKRLANLTDIALSTVKVVYQSDTDTFGLRTGPIAPDYYDTALRRVLAFRGDHPHLRVFASLDKGAWMSCHSDSSRGGAHSAFALGHAAGDRYRAQFVQAIVAMMEEYGLDGLDIDWEYPNINSGSTPIANGEYEKYGLLMRDLAEVFFDRGWELSMCINQNGWQIPGGEVCAAADFVNSMAYGPWPAFHGNGVMTQAINQCLRRNIPRRRVIVGQSMYANASYHLGWGELYNRLRSLPYFDICDADTIWESWAYNGKSGAYMNFTGPTTYRAKCNRAKQEGFGGVMSWCYYGDASWAASLALHQAQTVWPHDAWPEPPRAADGFALLDSEEDWFWLQEHPGTDARLIADITLTHDPLPIPAFARTLDGGGHTLTLGPDVWICDFGDAALFGTLSGAVRDLTVVLQGRVVSLADRANDTTVSDESTLEGDSRAALLAGALAGATLERVTLRVEAGAEIQGAVQTAVAAANLYAETPAANVLRDVRAEIAGAVRNNATTSSGAAFHPVNTLVGGLVGWVGGPAQGGNVLERCAVSLAPTARVANETGEQDAAGGAVGHLHNKADPRIVGLDVRWADGAEVVGRAVTECSPMPWCATYYARELPAGSVGGRVIPAPGAEGAFRARWPTYWLEPFAPFGRLGFGLFLR